MAEYMAKLPFSTPLYLLKPKYEVVKGVNVKRYPDATNDMLIYASFKSYGGTEKVVNDLYSIEDTANIETWYRPDIRSDCRIMREDGAIYKIINEPENINMRNQFMKFKVRRIKGGA